MAITKTNSPESEKLH